MSRSSRETARWVRAGVAGRSAALLGDMLSAESLQVAEEEVVESCSNRLCDIYSFVAKGCFPQSMNALRKKNLKRFAQKFIIDGEFNERK